MNGFVIGIDPGVSGCMGIAARKSGPFEYYKLPATPGETWSVFNAYAKNTELVVVERISPRPGQSLRGTITSCTRYGWLQMMVSVHGRSWDTVFVTANTWQRALGLGKKWPKHYTEQKRYSERKKFNRLRAIEMFPDLKITHMNADGLLITKYAEGL